MVNIDDIKDITHTAEYCKQRMKRCEQNAEKALQEGELGLVAKFEGHLFAWTELLEKAQHETHQQGKGAEDLTVALTKDKQKRFNANPGGKRGNHTSEPRTVGDERDTQNVAAGDESIRLATSSPLISISPDDTELQQTVGQVVNNSGEVSSQGPNYALRAHLDYS